MDSLQVTDLYHSEPRPLKQDVLQHVAEQRVLLLVQHGVLRCQHARRLRDPTRRV